MTSNGTTAIPSAAAKHVMASGVSSSMAVPGQGAICWSAFSPLTGNFYLIDPGTNTVTEVTVNSATYKPTMIKVCELFTKFSSSYLTPPVAIRLWR